MRVFWVSAGFVTRPVGDWRVHYIRNYFNILAASFSDVAFTDSEMI